MIWKPEQKYEQILESEIGTIRKSWNGRLSVAAVYPNTYHVGMSNLGFQTVYRLLNKLDSVVCERSFLPDKSPRRAERILSLESKRPIKDFDIIAFSISFKLAPGNPAISSRDHVLRAPDGTAEVNRIAVSI